jgi:hypothetical protein
MEKHTTLPKLLISKISQLFWGHSKFEYVGAISDFGRLKNPVIT